MKPVLLLSAPVIALLVACASPQSHFYSLVEAVFPSAQAVSTQAARVPLVLTAVTLPEAVDRPQLVVRKNGVLRVMEQRRWVQPLRSDIAQVLCADLSRRLGVAVAGPGQEAGRGAPWRLTVDIRRLDAVLGGPVALEALWTLSRADGSAADSGLIALSDRAADDSYDALVAAQARLLTALAAAIRLEPVKG